MRLVVVLNCSKIPLSSLWVECLFVVMLHFSSDNEVTFVLLETNDGMIRERLTCLTTEGCLLVVEATAGVQLASQSRLKLLNITAVLVHECFCAEVFVHLQVLVILHVIDHPKSVEMHRRMLSFSLKHLLFDKAGIVSTNHSQSERSNYMIVQLFDAKVELVTGDEPVTVSVECLQHRGNFLISDFAVFADSH